MQMSIANDPRRSGQWIILVILSAGNWVYADDVRYSESQSDLETFACDSAFPHCGITPNQFGNSTVVEIALFSTDCESVSGFLNLSPSQRGAIMELAKTESADKIDNDAIAKLLTVEQRARIERIAFFIDGGASLLRPSIQADLKMSQATIHKLSDLATKYRRDYVGPLNSSYFGSSGEHKEPLAKYVVAATKLNCRFNLQSIALLTEKERTELAEFIRKHANTRDLAMKMLRNRYSYSIGLHQPQPPK